MPDHPALVQIINHRICILGQRCRENNHFKNLTHALHEFINKRSFENVDIVNLVFNFHRNNKVRTRYGLISSALIQIEDEI